MNYNFDFFSNKLDDNDTENPESKRLTGPLDNSNSLDDDNNKRGNIGDISDSLEIKRERNESGGSKIDVADAESNTVNSGKFAFFSFIFHCVVCKSRFEKKYYDIIKRTAIQKTVYLH